MLQAGFPRKQALGWATGVNRFFEGEPRTCWETTEEKTQEGKRWIPRRGTDQTSAIVGDWISPLPGCCWFAESRGMEFSPWEVSELGSMHTSVPPGTWHNRPWPPRWSSDHWGSMHRSDKARGSGWGPVSLLKGTVSSRGRSPMYPHCAHMGSAVCSPAAIVWVTGLLLNNSRNTSKRFLSYRKVTFDLERHMSSFPSMLVPKYSNTLAALSLM